MTPDLKKLKNDPDGLLTYEYIANNIGLCDEHIDALADNIINVDRCGQFTASAARYLYAINPEKYGEAIRRLVAATIEKDREHKYLAGVLQGIYGNDYHEKAKELSANDDNFRRIYKRLFPNPESL